MSPARGSGIALVALGVVGLTYGGFQYTKESETTKVGPFELTVKDERTVHVSIWAGVAVIILGVGLLLVPAKR